MNDNTPEAQPADLNAAGNRVPPSKNRLFIGPQGLRPFWGLLLYLVVLAVPIALLSLAFHLANAGKASGHHTMHSQFTPLAAITGEWLQFGLVFFATWIMSRIEGHSVLDYGLQRSPRIRGWLTSGAFWGLLAMSLLIATLWGTHHLVFTGVLLRPLPALGYGLAWAVAFIGVGFFEEFLFRGYLQFNLTRCFAGLFRWIAPRSRHAGAAGFWTAAVLISFGFGLVHRSNGGESPIGLLCAGLAGLMFAFTLWRTGSLWWAIGLHAAWDWAQSFLYGVADSGSISQGHLLASHPAGSTLMSGGLTGPEGSLFVLPMMLLITLIAVFTLRRDTTSYAVVPWSGTQPVDSPSGTLA